jgi:hypothetical protein
VTSGSRRGAVLVGAVLVAVAALTGSVLVRPGEERNDATRRAAARFLDRYVGPDGRVARTDQGGDTVSEGQAYAMLIAQAVGDRRRFERAWGWARHHLQRGDGLLAWRWADGRVEDAMPATDADLDAAWALVLASKRFGRRRFGDEGRQLAAAVLDHETVWVPDGLLLVAGPWAREHPPVANPSYISPAAFAVLGAETADRRWASLATTSLRMVSQLMTPARPLPPDWARVGAAGGLEPVAGSGQAVGPRFGPDAARLLPRMAMCRGPWRAMAASTWPVLSEAGHLSLAISSSLDGAPLDATPHPVKAVAAAGAAHAAGDGAARERLLEEAERLERRAPTYYGAAWVALGRLLLASSLGDQCGWRGPQSSDGLHLGKE